MRSRAFPRRNTMLAEQTGAGATTRAPAHPRGKMQLQMNPYRREHHPLVSTLGVALAVAAFFCWMVSLRG
jgi:hypothetical protein